MTFDYGAELEPGNISELESYMGGTLPLTTFVPGSGFDPITVSAVPEPATYPALMAMGAIVFSAFRRRRRIQG